MRSLEALLTQYAASHRDRRNIATHLVGIPLIAFAIVLALALVSFTVDGMPVTLAAVAAIGAGAYYLRLDPAFGAAMAVTLFLLCALASEIIARLSPGAVLGVSAALFAGGWALQFWGHRFEGMKPAFLDDMKLLLIGPLFVCAEIFFFLGARPELKRYIDERVGPTVARRQHPAAGETR